MSHWIDTSNIAPAKREKNNALKWQFLKNSQTRLYPFFHLAMGTYFEELFRLQPADLRWRHNVNLVLDGFLVDDEPSFTTTRE